VGKDAIGEGREVGKKKKKKKKRLISDALGGERKRGPREWGEKKGREEGGDVRPSARSTKKRRGKKRGKEKKKRKKREISRKGTFLFSYVRKGRGEGEWCFSFSGKTEVKKRGKKEDPLLRVGGGRNGGGKKRKGGKGERF